METLDSFGYLHVYKGYALFKQNAGKIIKSPLEETKGLLINHRGKKFIVVNGNLGMREQVKTLIHEFLHFSYSPHDYTPLYFNLLDNKEKQKKLEDNIERETVRIYENQPRLVKHLRELLLDVSYRENYRLEMERLYRKGKSLGDI